MAQVQNNRPQGPVANRNQQQANGKTNQNANVRYASNSWSFKAVNQKDKNNISWPFKVIRDEGKQSKMVIRSMSDLNQSFEGTKYTLTSCDKIQGRYSLLYAFFKNYRDKSPEYIGKITHLLFTYSGVYYLLKDDKEVKFWNYEKLLRTEKFDNDMLSVTKSVLYTGKVYETAIRNAFNNYKVYHTPESEKMVEAEVRRYISCRTGMKVIDSAKPMIDVLNSDLNFTSLKTIVFVTDKRGKVDFGNSVSKYINDFNIVESNFQGLQEAKLKIPTFYIEEDGVHKFIEELKAQKKQASIRTFYEIPGLKDYSKEAVKELFENGLNEEYKNTEFEKYVSQAELNSRNKNSEKDKAEEEEEKAKVLKDIINATEDINKMIKIMVEFTKACQEIYAMGEQKKTIEFGIWIKQYSLEKISNRINILFNYSNNEGRNRNLPVISVAREFSSKIHPNLVVSQEDFEYFYKYICPNNFSDQRCKLNIEGVDYNTLKGLKTFNTKIIEVYKEMLELFEIYLGLQYAMFACFLKRYGESDALINVVKGITSYLNETYNSELPMTITENVKERANIALLLIQFNFSDLTGYKPGISYPNIVTKDELKDSFDSFRGKYSDFVVRYIKAYGNGNIAQPTKSVDSKGYFEDLTSLLDVAFCINNILSQCNLYVNLPLRKDIIDKIMYSDISDKNLKG